MTTEEIINQKADYLIRVELIDSIETLDDTNYKKGISLIEKYINEIDFKSHKIQFLDRIISGLEHHKKKHQKGCPERKKENSICYFELHYDEVVKFCNKKKKKFIIEQSTISFEDKIKLIFQELATRPNRQGDLEEILKECDISYTQNDFREYINYFKETDYVYTGYITKDKIDIKLNQSGLGFLKEKPKEQFEQIIHIVENYQNSVVAKGNHINQSFDSSSTNPLYKNPTKNPDNPTSNVAKIESNSDLPPTKKLQKISILVAIILSIIAITVKILMDKGII